jgi:hypothetical protein
VAPPRCLFFTGKGGVGKTSIACASAIALADGGRRVLLVSTDPASNLDEMLGLGLRDAPREVPGVPRLSAMNIDPTSAADAYRARVLARMEGASEAARATVREQLSGACTTEVAAFDEFAALVAEGAPGFDHVDMCQQQHRLQRFRGSLQNSDKIAFAFKAGNDDDPCIILAIAGIPHALGQLLGRNGAIAVRKSGVGVHQFGI